MAESNIEQTIRLIVQDEFEKLSIQIKKEDADKIVSLFFEKLNLDEIVATKIKEHLILLADHMKSTLEDK